MKYLQRVFNFDTLALIMTICGTVVVVIATIAFVVGMYRLGFPPA